MPHPRERHLFAVLQKRLKSSPVVTIQGARQTGKSFLVRELLQKKVKTLQYVTFDHAATKKFAEQNPDTFIQQNAQARPLAIDEAQKVPDIFDAIKYEVDQQKIPGKFLLLGSSEFSKETLIKEPLTGRMARVRLYPMNIRETLGFEIEKKRNRVLIAEQQVIKRRDLLTYFERGGFPGIFAVRDKEDRRSLLRDWLELTVSRDAMLIPKLKINPDLLMSIIEELVRQETPDQATLSSILKVDQRRIKSHLLALEILFVVHPIHPHPLGTGKTRYFLLDLGLLEILNASFEKKLATWVLLEQLSQRSYIGDRSSKLFYYRNQKGSILDLVVEDGEYVSALKILPTEKVLARDLLLLTSFANKNSQKKISLFALAGNSEKQRWKDLKIDVHPWESIG